MLCFECGHNDDAPYEQCTANFKAALATRMAMAGAEYCNIHLTGTNSGRFNTALVAPLHIPALREWVREHYEYTTARQVTGNAHCVYHDTQKASKGIAQRQYAAIQEGAMNLSIIMSRDKDLATCSGMHCDWSTYEIKKATASFLGLLGIAFSWLLMQGRCITSKAINCIIMLPVFVMAFASRHYLIPRKRRATRAILYLQRIAYGATIQEANELVLSLDASTLTDVQGETNVMLYDIYTGNESAAVQHAILEGFKG